MNNDICFKIQIVDECNLNCKGCDHFAPLAKKWHQPLNDYINMIKTLKEQSKGKIKELISNGSASEIRETIDKCVFYKDLNREKTSIYEIQNLSEIDEYLEEYNYVFENEKWHFFTGSNKMKRLTPRLIEMDK